MVDLSEIVDVRLEFDDPTVVLASTLKSVPSFM